ncbi:43kDa postsynaptic protein [Parasponia andersonii]|uniref:43kDa postsynaptic protein n=1 Tax=Parasponia andersonii TaxID=3476 RepID=A0A2P5CX28_PARAD|nr:43kDa postsynaptic protein [Parasponia andersonii]
MEPVTYNEAGVKAAYMYSSNGECIDGEESKDNGRAVESLEKGAMQYGCQHYRRRCRIRAPCCNEIFDCRHCHNEAKASIKSLQNCIYMQNNINVDQKLRHDIPRHQVTQVICSLCGTEQEVQQVCINCGVCMGEYFCDVCKLFDDDISKQQYHCSGCGICRIGGRENFFHCYKCGCCYSMLLKNSHPCVEGAMHHDCPVCFEFLFESLSDITVLPCGHTIHTDCLKEMQEHAQYACPLCSKSVCDMSRVWEKFDVEIAATPMPEPYQNKLIWILCNDCGKTSKVPFHLVAQKSSWGWVDRYLSGLRPQTSTLPTEERIALLVLQLLVGLFCCVLF